jgi:hypothetical protein
MDWVDVGLGLLLVISETLGATKLKENSVFQMIYTVLRWLGTAKPYTEVEKETEDGLETP